MRLVDPLREFGALLNTVQAPSRYLGGEYGAAVKPHSPGDGLYNVAMAFPDLYEIGMSNLAIKIIYNGLNACGDVRCELVFAPDTDFEALLRQRGVPLYTLGTGMPLGAVDMVAFSIGYELCATEVLAILDAGGIPLLARDRGEGDPIVIAGGCGVTNPAPMGDFFDAVMVGEAEDGLFPLVRRLAAMTREGASRAQKLAYVSAQPFIWTQAECGPGKKVARRAVQGDFGLVPSVPSWFPLPVIKPVQDHGAIEIMRGCPNGCRFCHAGVYYRPARVKGVPLIIEEIDHLVFDAGYREISLNSLSSADFPGIEGLLDVLNERYRGYNVSFQLPSLKVNSISLPVLEKLSAVRRSGLTFAVETPDELWQLSLNKEVYAQHLEQVIREAKAKGWSSAKFYFMIGLFDGENAAGKSEEEAIVDFLLELQGRTHIQCNVNVGVFIPKPHTPYQWARQLRPEEAARKMDYIYRRLPRGKFKLGRHTYDATMLEGLLSRGDGRAGALILRAYQMGARFDAWDDHLRQNMAFWNGAFAEAGWDVQGWIYQDWDEDAVLPWDGVSLGPPKAFYRRERRRSEEHVLTPRCEAGCGHPCGICRTAPGGTPVAVHARHEVEAASAAVRPRALAPVARRQECNIPVLYRVVFSFARAGGAEYTAYLSQVEEFHKAILRSGLPAVFTAGFNPLPRLEFATAMPLGVPSYEEVASCYLYDPSAPEDFMERMNRALPARFQIQRALVFPVTNLRKREALSQGLWGGLYEYRFAESCSASAFFASGAAGPFLRQEGCRFFAGQDGAPLGSLSGGVPQDIRARLPVSDKAFRQALEAFFGRKWYAVAAVAKLRTLANPAVAGWTARDEENRRAGIASGPASPDGIPDADPGEPGEPVSFMELYAKIAQINGDLIQKRQELDARRGAFYAEHPDVFARHSSGRGTVR